MGFGQCFCRFDRLENISIAINAKDTSKMVSIGASRDVPSPNFALPVVRSESTNKKNASRKKKQKSVQIREKSSKCIPPNHPDPPDPVSLIIRR